MQYPTPCNFWLLGTAKKKKKGLRVLKKGFYANSMGNSFINNFFPTPFDNCMGKGVIYFFPVKLLPAPEKYTGGDHKMLSNV